MAISGNLPKHLEVAARTGVLGARAQDNMPYRRVAMEVDLTAASTTFVDLGGLPVPTQDPKAVDTMIEKGKTVEPTDWHVTVSLSQNAIDDDQTGMIESRFRDILPAFQRHINDLTFIVLNAGDTATYGTGITNETEFFADAHLYPGGSNTTAQDNLNALTLSDDNFNTVWVAMRQRKDDAGNFYNLNPNLLIVSPTNNKIAANITGNPQSYDTANREMNPYAGGTQYFTVPQFDTTAWVLIDENYSVKPMFVAIRKRPMLQNMWFDSQQPDGGKHYFKFHGRYVIGFGDPLLATMGNS
jgi:phage major head subunit gpT-like protein